MRRSCHCLVCYNEQQNTIQCDLQQHSQTIASDSQQAICHHLHLKPNIYGASEPTAIAFRLSILSFQCCCSAMSNQGNRSMSSQGGRGKDSSQQLVISLRRRGFDDKMLPSELKAQGYSKSNISRLIKRQHEREAGLSAQMSGKGRPSSFQAPASIAVLSVIKKPAASQLSDDNVDEDEIVQASA